MRPEFTCEVEKKDSPDDVFKRVRDWMREERITQDMLVRRRGGEQNPEMTYTAFPVLATTPVASTGKEVKTILENRRTKFPFRITWEFWLKHPPGLPSEELL